MSSRSLKFATLFALALGAGLLILILPFAATVQGKAPYPVTHDQIIHGVAVFEAIVQSAKTGRPVKVG